MKGIAVIADRDTAILFKLAGVGSSFIADSPEEAEEVLRSILDKDFGIIVLTKGLAQSIQRTIAKLAKDRKYPIILVIPGKGEPIEKETISAQEYIKKALGIGLRQANGGG